MTPTVTPRHRRGASLAIGGIMVAGSMLIGAPLAGAAPSTEAVDAINSHYTEFGGEGSPLGAAIGDVIEIPGGAERDFAEGAIFYSKDTGAKAMYGEIYKKYKALGGPGGELGFPTEDEADTGDGQGRFNDFTEKDGQKAAIYWGPNTGAWLVKGRVLDAWRASGDIKGPFGYPKDDTISVGDTLTSNFVGPDGTQISWSKAAGLVTIPAALAGTINLPSISATASAPAAATPSVTKPSVTAEAPTVEKKGGFKWWWLLPLLLLPLLFLLFRRKSAPAPAPVKVTTRAPEVKKVVTPPAPPVKKVVAPPPPPPVKKVVAPPPPPPVNKVVAPPPPPPVKKVVAPPPPPPVSRVVAPPPPPPVKKVVVPPAPPRPVVEPPKLVERAEQKVEHVAEKVDHTAEHVAEKIGHVAEKVGHEAEHAVEKVGHKAEHVADKADHKAEHVAEKVERFVEAPRATIHEARIEHETTPVIRYETHTPAETTIQVTYENNAVDGKESRADKSDLTPDHLQE